MSKTPLRARTQAFRRQAGRCFYCGCLMWTGDCKSFAAQHRLPPKLALLLQCTAEHLLARQDGGSNTRENVAAACLVCNRRRHARKRAPPPEQYRALVAHRMANRRWHQAAVFESGIALLDRGNPSTS